MGTKQRFKCVCCSTVYANGGRFDLPRCPRCGCHSSLFPEWLKARRSGD